MGKLNDDIAFWHWARARQAKSGQSWSSYWATLISATVEDAAPTHVVLTFPIAQTSLVASDFTIGDYTISSATWVGAVLTLVLDETITVFDELTITFVKTNETAAVTNNVADDGKTISSYESDNSATITKDGGNIVSRVNDELGSGNDLVTGTCLWTSTGFLFNGTNQYLKTGDIVGFNQPAFIYALIKVESWEANDRIFEGKSNDKMLLYQVTASPQITTRAGAVGPGLASFLVGSWGILRVKFNGASSSIQLNENTATTGNSGTNNPEGITIARYGEAALMFGNIRLKKAIFRMNADDATIQANIYKSIKKKYCKTIAVIGDSNSDGGSEWCNLIPTLWTGTKHPLILSKAKSGARIVNIADNETTNPYMLSQVTALQNVDTDIILIAIGTNDRDSDARIGTEYRANLDLLKTHHPNAAIYCLSVFPNTTDPDAIRDAVNVILQAQVTAVGGITWWDTETWVDRANDFADQFHLDASGHAAVAAEVRSILDV